MERNIKNPSLVPEWFIYSGSKVMGVSGADGRQYYFVGSSEKGEDGKTPDIRINAEKGYIWESRYAPDNWNEIPGSPAASGLVGPQGETGLSGDSVKVDSIVNENGGTTVTLAWGENFEETSSFFVPSGLSGANGKDGQDGISPAVIITNITDAEHNNGGVEVRITDKDHPSGLTYSAWNGNDGTNGTDGKDGISPTVTVTNIPADPLNPDHQNGGTEITITDATTTNKFSAWNGNDGTMAGAPDIEGKNGISAVLDSSTYEVGLSSEFYKAVTSVSSKLDESVAASTYATKDALNDYLTKDAAVEAYQPKGNYLSANALNGYATETWVREQGYLSAIPSEYITETELADYNYVTTATTNSLSSEIEEISSTLNDKYTLSAGTGIYFYEDSINKTTRIDCTVTAATTVAQLTDSANYYTINQTSAASELTTEFAKYALLANIPTKVTDLTDSANYVVTGDILTGTGNKLTGIKIGSTNYTVPTTDLSNYYTKSQTSAASALSAEFAKYLTSVITDTTLTGDGTDNSHKLGVAWSTLSGNTIVSAKSANSTEYITNGIGYSGFNDISAKFGSLSSYVPFSATVLPIGTSNTATTNAAAIGGLNSAVDLSFALGNANTAKTTGCAIGEHNFAYNKSVAIGYQNTADYNVDIAIGYQCSAHDHGAAFINLCTASNQSIAAGNKCFAYAGSVAFGNCTSAYDNSVALGHGSDSNYNIANNYSFLAGDACSAFSYSQAFGRGVVASGNSAGTGIGLFAIGGWNATTANALFVIGNGSWDSNIGKRDALVVHNDGTVSAKQFQNADGTDTIHETTYNFTGVDNIEILPLAATANTAYFPNDNVLRFILES